MCSTQTERDLQDLMSETSKGLRRLANQLQLEALLSQVRTPVGATDDAEPALLDRDSSPGPQNPLVRGAVHPDLMDKKRKAGPTSVLSLPRCRKILWLTKLLMTLVIALPR